MSAELKQYIKASLERGTPRDGVLNTLVKAGWSADVVEKYLDHYRSVDDNGLAIPAPRLQAHHLAQDLFIYSLTVITLFLAMFAFGNLLFQAIDKFFDQEKYRWWSPDNVNWMTAQLVISFIIYAVMNWWTQKNIRQYPEKRESFVRKLMIYLMIGVSAIVCIVDLIVLLSGFLGGDTKTAFVLKSITVMVMSILVFGYYAYEVRRDDRLVQRKQG
jgi:hypothetical protein